MLFSYRDDFYIVYRSQITNAWAHYTDRPPISEDGVLAPDRADFAFGGAKNALIAKSRVLRSTFPLRARGIYEAKNH